MDAAFKRDYPTTSSSELAARYGVSLTTIARWAATRGLRKTPEYRSELARRRIEQHPIPLQRGADHWNWKGGRPWERFRDPRYIAWRKEVLERDGYRCRNCGRQCKRHERGLAAHHILEWATNPERRFDVANGLTLCRDCHMTLHGLGPRIVAKIPCACGCGTLIPERDVYGRPRRFVNRHGKRGTTMSTAAREQLSRDRRGRPLTRAHRAKISAGLRNSTKRIGRPPRSSSAAAPPSS